MHPRARTGIADTRRLAAFARAATLMIIAAVAVAQDHVTVMAKRNPSATYAPYDTRLVSLVPGFTSGASQSLDQYGGRNDLTATARGFFYASKIGNRWWIVDPLGHLYLTQAVDSVTPGSSAIEKDALTRTFGTVAAWADRTAQLLEANGFNSTGAWSDTASIRASAHPLPYTKIWNFMSSYGKSTGRTTPQSGHTGYPRNAIFVFDAAFPGYCDTLARQLVPDKDDPYLLGHFSDNELPFLRDSLDNFLSLPAADEGRKGAQAWFDARRGHAGATIAEADAADRSAFLGHIVDRYMSIVAGAIRRYDPNHMYLGSRFYTDDYRTPEAMQAAGRHVDAVSINLYNQWTPSLTQSRAWAAWSGKPFMVTEFYTKGEDSGLANTTGAGWIVPTQTDRGYFYQNFTLSLLESQCCVGWQLFQYQDNDPAQVGAELSNKDSNKGIVTIRYDAWTAYLAQIAKLNRETYHLARHFDGAVANRAPTVAITSPSSGAAFAAPATVSIAASAADADGAIARVEFRLDGTLIHTELQAPYAFSWSGIAAGAHTLAAKAFDDLGASTGSAEIAFTVSSVPPAGGTGLAARYYDHIDFTGTTVSRVDHQVDFDWGSAQPATGISGDTFSVRWSGQVLCPTAETYSFRTSSDDGVRLWIDGRLVIDNWTSHAVTENQGAISLTAGKHAIRLDYFENTGRSVCRLLWSTPTRAMAVVPQAALFPASVTASEFEEGPSAPIPEMPATGNDGGRSQPRCGLGASAIGLLALVAHWRRRRSGATE